jgi:uncharacterized membrane protein YkoI
MSKRTHISRGLAVALLAMLPQQHAAKASTPANACYAAWSDAAPVVHREALTAVRDLHTQARQRNLGDVVRVTLCTEEGRFVYRLIVREPQGRVVPMTVDARQPFAP